MKKQNLNTKTRVKARGRTRWAMITIWVIILIIVLTGFLFYLEFHPPHKESTDRKQKSTVKNDSVLNHAAVRKVEDSDLAIPDEMIPHPSPNDTAIVIEVNGKGVPASKENPPPPPPPLHSEAEKEALKIK